MANKRRMLFILLILTVIVIAVTTSFYKSSPKIEEKSSETKLTKCQTTFATYEVVEKNIKEKKYKLLVADSDASHAQGLMNVKSKKDICGHDGMLFVFEKAGIQTFWNQNTLVDLDLYWMMGDRVIREDKLVNIADNGMKIYSSLLPVDRVVEIISK